MKRLIISLYLLAATAHAQFVIPVTVSDGEPLNRTLAFGLIPDGHFCLNSSDTYGGYQEMEYPPPPPFEPLGIRILNPHRPASVFDDCFGMGAYVDFRPLVIPGQRDTFFVNADDGGIVSAQWGTGLDAYVSELRLVDTVSNGGVFNINMLTTQSAVLPPGHRQFRILMRNAYTPSALLAVSPVSLNFGLVATGTSITDSVLVTNTGEVQLSIDTITVHGSSDFTVNPVGPISLPPAGSQKFFIHYHPTATGSHSASLVFASNAVSSPDTVALSGTGIQPTPVYFLSVSPDTLVAEEPARPGKFLKAVKRGKDRYPNWANLRDETIAQGGFRPGTSESDSAGGVRIGVSFMERRNPGDPAKPNWKPVKEMAKQYCWIRIGKWNFKKSVGASAEAIPKTLRSMGTIFHSGPPRGLDSTGEPGDIARKVLKGELKKLEPKKTSNRLFAELVALKLNIAMSALGKTPAGFGELRFRRSGSLVDGLEIGEIARLADTMLTRWGGRTGPEYDSLFAAISSINRAFLGPLDTLGNWEQPLPGFPKGTLRAKGAVDVYDIPYLELPSPFVPTLLAASSGEVEPEEDPDEQEDEDATKASVPLALKLYQNFPNPFNPSTMIAFRLANASRVTITIYDLLGREAGRVVEKEEFEEGYQEISFMADGLATGTYFYRIIAEGLEENTQTVVETRKMILLK